MKPKYVVKLTESERSQLKEFSRVVKPPPDKSDEPTSYSNRIAAQRVPIGATRRSVKFMKYLRRPSTMSARTTLKAV